MHSQPVFVCAICGEIDYGDDPDGPGVYYCRNECVMALVSYERSIYPETAIALHDHLVN